MVRRILACGGGCSYDGAASQRAAAERFLRHHRARLITIDIGGNDVNHCAAGAAIDQECAVAAVGRVAANLGRIVRRLRAAAPGVRIIGMPDIHPTSAGYARIAAAYPTRTR